MFRNLLIVFAAAVILGFGGSSQGTPTDVNVKSPRSDQQPQQVNHNIQNQINNWGLGNDDRKMLTEMKYKIDSLHKKSTSRGNSRFICVSILDREVSLCNGLGISRIVVVA